MTKASGISSCWAITLADLALILFIVTASHASDQPPEPPAQIEGMSVDAIPQAIYAPGPDAPPLEEWITEQDLGPGASVDVSIGYNPADLEKTLEEAKAITTVLLQSGKEPRVTLVPGADAPRIVFSYSE